jgi:hypothetical protein
MVEDKGEIGDRQEYLRKALNASDIASPMDGSNGVRGGCLTTADGLKGIIERALTYLSLEPGRYLWMKCSSNRSQLEVIATSAISSPMRKRRRQSLSIHPSLPSGW